MGNVVFDDFKKLEIRIGKILSSEKIKGTDKLFKLEVDFGDSIGSGSAKRQIVSGLAEVYSPEDLIGKQFPFLVNLVPRFIKGIESKGMILAVDDNGKPVLMSPDKEVALGSEVK